MGRGRPCAWLSVVENPYVSSQTHPPTHAYKRTHAYGFGLGHGSCSLCALHGRHGTTAPTAPLQPYLRLYCQQSEKVCVRSLLRSSYWPHRRSPLPAPLSCMVNARKLSREEEGGEEREEGEGETDEEDGRPSLGCTFLVSFLCNCSLTFLFLCLGEHGEKENPKGEPH